MVHGFERFDLNREAAIVVYCFDLALGVGGAVACFVIVRIETTIARRRIERPLDDLLDLLDGADLRCHDVACPRLQWTHYGGVVGWGQANESVESGSATRENEGLGLLVGYGGMLLVEPHSVVTAGKADHFNQLGIFQWTDEEDTNGFVVLQSLLDGFDYAGSSSWHMIRDSTGSGAPWEILTISSWILHLKQRKVAQISLNDFIRMKSIGLSYCFDYKPGFFRVDDMKSTEGSKFIWAIVDHHARQEERLPLYQSFV